MAANISHKPLFGGNRAWSPHDWISVDDRVRGGSSYSTLACSPASAVARFQGNLDIMALGGAGFASQRTTSESGPWDLSDYDGVELNINGADGKVYTITLSDSILPKRPDGREQSTLNWEYDFRADGPESVFIKWDYFKPTYRGKPADATKPLDLKEIKKIGIMVRSFFGEQQGEFSLDITSIAALRTDHYLNNPNGEE